MHRICTVCVLGTAAKLRGIYSRVAGREPRWRKAQEAASLPAAAAIGRPARRRLRSPPPLLQVPLVRLRRRAALIGRNAPYISAAQALPGSLVTAAILILRSGRWFPFSRRVRASSPTRSRCPRWRTTPSTARPITTTRAPGAARRTSLRARRSTPARTSRMTGARRGGMAGGGNGLARGGGVPRWAPFWPVKRGGASSSPRDPAVLSKQRRPHSSTAPTLFVCLSCPPLLFFLFPRALA